MSDYRFSRRRMLESIGGAAIFLPLLGARKGLAATTFPKRVIIIQTTNGTVHDSFWPKNTSETGFELDSTILKPLAPYKKDVLLIGGLELRAALDEKIPTAGGLGHHSLPHLLTGAPGAAGRLKDGRTDPIGNSISIDQHIANGIAMKEQTPFKSLELGILVGALTNGRSDNDGLISFNGKAIGSNPARPNGNLPEENPYKVQQKLFTAAGTPGRKSAVSEDDLKRLQDQRKSAIDFIRQDLARLQTNLGSDDKQKIEAHLDGLRRLEQELGSPGKVANCKVPALDGPMIDLKKASSMPAIAKAQFDLIVAAMSCDLTRVATVMMCNGSNENLAMTWLGAGFDGPPAAVGAYTVRDHHNLTHCGCFRTQKIRAEQWFMEQFAYLVGELKKIPEGTGTMLDNTVVLLANNMDDGANHTCRGMPWVMAGSAGGYFKTGRYLRYGDWGKSSYYKGSNYVPHNGLLIGLANAMGVPTETFGDKKYGGELSGLRG